MTLKQSLSARWTRLTRFEWWPICLVYLPIVPVWLFHVLRRGGVLGFTCANPGIASGGGLIDEAKGDILRALGDQPCILHAELIEAGEPPEARAQTAIKLIETHEVFGGFPAVLKPDCGERGASVRIVRDAGEVRAYFELVPEPVLVQCFHPGPEEFGVFWVRNPETIDTPPVGGEPHGRITSITHKVFPEVIGDGRRTVAELIFAHPRYRCQAKVFFERLGQKINTIPAKNECFTLGRIGNHSQGARFDNADELITPRLEAVIDRLATGFAGGFDFGRFDIRCESPEALARGDIAVIELNGVASEDTNMYHPGLTPWRAWGVLFVHWRRLFELGERRYGQGVRPMTLGQVFKQWRGSKSRSNIRAG